MPHSPRRFLNSSRHLKKSTSKQSALKSFTQLLRALHYEFFRLKTNHHFTEDSNPLQSVAIQIFPPKKLPRWKIPTCRILRQGLFDMKKKLLGAGFIAFGTSG